mmetsp:Transcript_12424/g.52243  ORF Transcript_12424/g.52243 Transcript_12424/m.52243 type:complete len:202 (-) Transcript_12424:5701-6306(-)
MRRGVCGRVRCSHSRSTPRRAQMRPSALQGVGFSHLDRQRENNARLRRSSGERLEVAPRRPEPVDKPLCHQSINACASDVQAHECARKRGKGSRRALRDGALVRVMRRRVLHRPLRFLHDHLCAEGGRVLLDRISCEAEKKLAKYAPRAGARREQRTLSLVRTSLRADPCSGIDGSEQTIEERVKDHCARRRIALGDDARE